MEQPKKNFFDLINAMDYYAHVTEFIDRVVKLSIDSGMGLENEVGFQVNSFVEDLKRQQANKIYNICKEIMEQK